MTYDIGYIIYDNLFCATTATANIYDFCKPKCLQDSSEEFILDITDIDNDNKQY